MKKLLMAAVGLIALVGVAMQPKEAMAVQIDGSIALVFDGVSQDQPTLATSTLFTFATIAFGPNTAQTGLFPQGDYSAVAPGIRLNTSQLNLTTQTFSYTTPSNTFGTFGDITSFVVVQQVADFLDVYIEGIFTPSAGGAMSGFEATPTSLRISLNQSGESISGGITQASPPEGIGIPEPATLALLGASLLGLGLARRRRD